VPVARRVEEAQCGFHNLRAAFNLFEFDCAGSRPLKRYHYVSDRNRYVQSIRKCYKYLEILKAFREKFRACPQNRAVHLPCLIIAFDLEIRIWAIEEAT
jgi:hypothetical protein